MLICGRDAVLLLAHDLAHQFIEVAVILGVDTPAHLLAHGAAAADEPRLDDGCEGGVGAPGGEGDEHLCRTQ